MTDISVRAALMDKETKVCSEYGRELPISEFNKYPQ